MTSVDRQLHEDIQLNPYNDVSRQTWRQSIHKHDVSQQTHTNKQLIFIYRRIDIQTQHRKSRSEPIQTILAVKNPNQ